MTKSIDFASRDMFYSFFSCLSFSSCFCFNYFLHSLLSFFPLFFLSRFLFLSLLKSWYCFISCVCWVCLAGLMFLNRNCQNEFPTLGNKIFCILLKKKKEKKSNEEKKREKRIFAHCKAEKKNQKTSTNRDRKNSPY